MLKLAIIFYKSTSNIIKPKFKSKNRNFCSLLKGELTLFTDVMFKTLKLLGSLYPNWLVCAIRRVQDSVASVYHSVLF